MKRYSLSKKGWGFLSLITFLIGVGVWIPNFLGYAKNLWEITFIINPLGALFGYKGENKLGIMLNILMTCSFFIVMFIGYLIVAVLGGKP